jgi:phage terminase large subunit GpA-like protein
MRAAVDRTTRVVVVRGASQIAKTESLILNVWAYRTVFDPAPAMMVLPSQTAAQDFSHQRIETLIGSCPLLRAVVTARGTGPRTEGASTITFKTFAGGFLKLTGTLSASELSQVAVRDLYLTEVDRYAIETENREGSPVHLAKLRQRTFEHTPSSSWNVRRRLQVKAGSSSNIRQGPRNTTFSPVHSAVMNRSY